MKTPLAPSTSAAWRRLAGCDAGVLQDINRQMLEQVNSALGSLSDHFAQLYQLIDGQAPPPPVQLEELVTRWTERYVMQSQWHTHQQVQPTGKAAAPTRNSAMAPPIELF